MTEIEFLSYEKRLNRLFETNLRNLRGEFVTKSEFTPVYNLVQKHEKVYNKVLNALTFIGAMVTLQFIFGNHWQGFIQFVQKVMH